MPTDLGGVGEVWPKSSLIIAAVRELHTVEKRIGGIRERYKGFNIVGFGFVSEGKAFGGDCGRLGDHGGLGDHGRFRDRREAWAPRGMQGPWEG